MLVLHGHFVTNLQPFSFSYFPIFLNIYYSSGIPLHTTLAAVTAGTDMAISTALTADLSCFGSVFFNIVDYI